MPYIGKKPADIIATVIDTTTGTFSGEVDAGSLDVSGNADIDGITNLDNTDIDGTLDVSGNLTVDTSTLKVDTTSNRVGIGTANPAFKGQVESPVALSGSGNDYYFAVGNSSINSRRSVALGVDGVFGNAVIAGYNNFNPGLGSLLIDGTDIQARTNGSERMRIDSSGNLLVGTTSTDLINNNGIVAAAAGYLDVGRNDLVARFTRRSSDGSIVQFRKDGTTVGSIGSEGGDALYIGNGDTGIKFSGGGDIIQPFNPSTTSARDAGVDLGSSGARFKDLYLSGKLTNNGTGGINIDTSGNVGIGTSSPSGLLQVEGSDGVAGGAIMYTASSVASGYMSADAAGLCLATDTAGITFRTGITGADPTDTGSERMRIDSSGNLLVGTTNANPAENNVAGIGALANNTLSITRDGNAPMQLNRKTSDGSIAIFRKDGSTVGSIGANGGQPYFINSSNKGIRPYTNGVAAAGSAGAFDDAAQDLGASSVRWRNLYLSGGVYLGGTGSANYLDDYEEGTFDVTIRDATSGGNTGSVTQTNKYVKIGNKVWMQFNLINITTTGMTSGNVLYFTGLPFTPASGSYGVGSVVVNQVNVGADCFGLNLFQNAGQSYASLLQNKDNVGSISTPVSAYDNSTADVFGTIMIEV